MKITVLFFGITTDLVGKTSQNMELKGASTIADFKKELQVQFSDLKHLNSYAIAVNESYENDEFILHENDIVAIIPPVSGG